MSERLSEKPQGQKGYQKAVSDFITYSAFWKFKALPAANRVARDTPKTGNVERKSTKGS